MGLDLRLPIGLMFTCLGSLLAAYGFVTASDPGLYQCSLGLNVNLYWGGMLFLFGGGMLFLALRDRKKVKPKPKEPNRSPRL